MKYSLLNVKWPEGHISSGLSLHEQSQTKPLLEVSRILFTNASFFNEAGQAPEAFYKFAKKITTVLYKVGLMFQLNDSLTEHSKGIGEALSEQFESFFNSPWSHMKMNNVADFFVRSFRKKYQQSLLTLTVKWKM